MNVDGENYTIRNNVGRSMHVRLYRSLLPSTGLVFHEHGRSGSMDSPHNQAIAHAWIEAGYTLVMVDATNSQSNPSEGGLQEFTMPQHVADLRSAIGWARSQDFYREPFALSGHSMGGFSALMLAAEFGPGIVQYVMVASPVIEGARQIRAKWEYQYEAMQEAAKTGWLDMGEHGETALLSWGKLMQWSDSTVLPQAHRLTMPVVAVVGTNDVMTPPRDVEILWRYVPGLRQIIPVDNA